MATQPVELDLFDGVELEMPQLLERAKVAEAAALAVPGITNSEGGSAGRSFGLSVYANTLGFSGTGWSGSHSISAAAIAGKDTSMERDWDYEAKTHFDERSEEHTYELQSLMRISYADFCLKKKT